ncbi:MAG: hypothetical protein LBM77_06795 [Spirochaetaceae bacterium]|jgi:hypothetical protein|nr:hypothetical protein [Spirochaetaceae bacterium]
MGKSHRGKPLRELVLKGRGVCPVCKRDGMKLLYEIEAGEQKVKVCKNCAAAIKHGKKSVAA